MDHQLKQDHVAGTSTAAAENSTPENVPPYLKLLVDCWEHIFDYLLLKDVHAMGGTCKPMHQLAGHYFREYFPNLGYELDKNEICAVISFDFNLRPDFYKFISKLEIAHTIEVDTLNTETFSSLKMLIFEDVHLTGARLGLAQKFLMNIENIELNYCRIAHNLFAKLATDCPKLKCLLVYYCNMENTVISELFSKHYPQLEHFQFEYKNKQISQLKLFLVKHLKLKRFSTNFQFLWATVICHDLRTSMICMYSQCLKVIWKRWQKA